MRSPATVLRSLKGTILLLGCICLLLSNALSLLVGARLGRREDIHHTKTLNLPYRMQVRLRKLCLLNTTTALANDVVGYEQHYSQAYLYA